MTRSDTETGPDRRYPDEPTRKHFAELTTRELHDILALRSQVFVVEQDCVYHDIDGRDIDPTTLHLWFDNGGEIAAYVRQLDDGDGVERIGRVVTDPAHRGQSLAAKLIADVIDRGHGPIVLDAQSHLADWYARFGFDRDGDEFVEDGIAHVPMRLDRDSHPVE